MGPISDPMRQRFRSFGGQRSGFLFPARRSDRLSLCLVIKSFVNASGPLEAAGTFSGSGCITSQREFSAAEQSRAS
jgi:hypothetical protein